MSNGEEEAPVIKLPIELFDLIRLIIASPYIDSGQAYLSWHSVNKKTYDNRGGIEGMLKTWRAKMEQVKLRLITSIDGKYASVYNSYIRDIWTLKCVCEVESFLKQYITQATTKECFIENRIEIPRDWDISDAETRIVYSHASILLRRNNWSIELIKGTPSSSGTAYICRLRQ